MKKRPSTAELLGLNDSVAPAPAPPSPSGEGRGRRFDAIVGGAYDGASEFNRSVTAWNPPNRSADADLLPGKSKMDSRTRDLMRNDAYVAGAARIHQDNIVGSQFTLNAKPDWDVLGLTEEWAAEFQKEVEAKFTIWAESPNNWVDASRKLTLTGLVRLGVGVALMGGEITANAAWMPKKGRQFRTAIQMIDSDRLSNPIYGPNTSRTWGGVTHDAYGAPETYHIRKAHPSDYGNPQVHQWSEIPARKPWGRTQFIHIYEQNRVDQTRGISELTSALKESRVRQDFRDVMLQNAVLQATFAASIESELPPEQVFEALGAGDTGNAALAYADEYLGAIAEYAKGSKNMMMNGVRIPHLYPGTKLQLRPAGQGGPLGTEFEASLLRYLAAALGVSYEQLSRDYTQTNYSSARAAMNETWKYMQSRKRFFADRFATIIYRLWLEEAINTDFIETLKGKAALFYTDGVQNLMFEALTQCDWIGASRGQIDELKETQAAVLRLKYNLTTQEDETARLGKDWRKINAQREREQKDQIERGLVVDPADASINAASGTPQEREKGDEPADSSADANAVDGAGTARDPMMFEAQDEPEAVLEDADDA